MKRTPQGGLLAQIGWRRNQGLERLQAGLHHFARLFKEDVAHIDVIVIQLGGHRSRYRHRNWRHRGWDRREPGLRRPRTNRLRRHRQRCRLNLFGGREQRRLARRRLVLGDLVAPHDGPELSRLLVIDKKLPGQRALVTQHVDQEAQRAQAVAELFKYADTGRAYVNLVHQKFFDAVAHTQRRQRCLVQTQHRKHPAHLRQLAGHLVQRQPVLRASEKLVKRFLNLAERGAQFSHHAAHGLAITDPAVEILHPALERLRLGAGQHAVEPLRQARAALCHVRLGRIEVVVGGLQVQHRSRHLHRNRSHGRFAQPHRRLDRPCQRARKLGAFRMQLHHRFGDRAKLVRSGFEPVGIAAGQGGPGLGRRGNAFARLYQQRRIETAKLRRRVVERLGAPKPIRLAHRNQRRGAGGSCRHRLGAIKQQVLCQAVNYPRLTARQRGVLRDDARRGAFDKHVGRAQPAAHRLKKRRGYLPEHARLDLTRRLRQTQADGRHRMGRLRVAGTYDLEYRLVNTRPHRGAISLRRHGGRQCHVDPAPFQRPQIGWVDTVAAHQFEHIAVLREQGDRRRRFTLEHAFQVFGQRKAGTLDLVGRVVAAQLRALDKLLRQRFHGAQNLGRCAQADHLQRAYCLVQLLARDP